MKGVFLITFISIALVIIISCSPAPPKGQEAVPERAASAPIKEQTSWGLAWDKILTEAKKEGRLNLYESWAPVEREAIVKEFKRKYPEILLESITAKGAELSQKLLTEKRAGLNLADLYIGGSSSIFAALKPAGLGEPLLPNFILPELSDPRQWWGGELPFLDEEKEVFNAQMTFSGPDRVSINTNLIRKDEIKSHQDLLDPRWKGKIALEDPTIAGGISYFFMVSYDVYGAEFWKGLAQNIAAITRDKRLITEWLAQGKYPIVISGAEDVMRPFEEAGAPIQRLFLPGIHYTSGKRSNIILIKERSHKYSPVLFLNWLLSKEAQTVWSKAVETQSARKDVPTDHLAPHEIYQPGISYIYIDKGKYLLERAKYYKLAEEILKPILK